MSEEEMLKCLIAFIGGYLVARMMGNGFQVGGVEDVRCKNLMPPCSGCAELDENGEVDVCGYIDNKIKCEDEGHLWCEQKLEEYIDEEFNPEPAVFDEEAHVYHHMYMDNMRSDENWNRFLTYKNAFPLVDVPPFDEVNLPTNELNKKLYEESDEDSDEESL